MVQQLYVKKLAKKLRQQALDGYVTLVTVIILAAASMYIASSILLINADASVASASVTKANVAKALADGCAEVALDRLKSNIAYTGNETLTLSTGTCQIRPVLGSGNTNRTVETTGNTGTVVRKVKVIIQQVNPTTVITSWQEVQIF